MTATKLITLRMALAIVGFAVFPLSAHLALVSICLFAVVGLIDWADGVFAETHGQRKAFGGFLDIAADQCIEMLFWLLFVQHGLVPIWIPAVIMVRNSFINLLRVDAIASGKTMFGDTSMLRSRLARVIVGARVSRGVMSGVKLVGFTAATLLYVGRTYGAHAVPLVPFNAGTLHATMLTFLILLVAIHIVRGTVIVRESHESLHVFLWSAREASADLPSTARTR